ncbi:hypothetical protein RJT34_26303 [Clitoria ternatea]|uniref:Uncharacterized protein n=1 Tax=Clitoria ternatea TaxID=43366 RepID=A0AAN9F6M9_CLITE
MYLQFHPWFAMEGHDELGLLGEGFDTSLLGRLRDDEYESRSGSENFDGGSGDEQDAGDDNSQKKKKKYHRHTPQQIQELEAFYKECPHPDEKQRADLSKRLNLESKQVKFWFQNRRTQMKTQQERHENMLLRQENEKLRAENSLMKEALANPICNNCGGPAIPGQISLEEHQARIENARLKDELNRICALSNKFLGRPLSSLASPIAIPGSNSGLELGIGRNGMGGSVNFGGMSLPMGLDVGDGAFSMSPAFSSMSGRSLMGLMGNEIQLERSMLIDLALNAMDELIKMAQPDTPLWIKNSDGRSEALNHEEYARMFSSYNSPKPAGYVTEVTRETGVVIVNSLALVDTLMDVDRWVEMFSTIVAGAVTVEVITGGMGGTRNGALQVMHAEMQMLSPLVPVRQLSFLRFCKMHGEGVWVVVDVAVDIDGNAEGNPLMNCRRLPSGCIVQDLANGFSKITWVEHSQYDESAIHQLYRPLVNSGIGFGAQRWIATLNRQCESLAILMSSPIPTDDPTAISEAGKRGVLKLAQCMLDYFCSGICASSMHKWEAIQNSNLIDDMRILVRKNVDDPAESPGIVLCASTSVWIPLSPQRVFDFLRDGRYRAEWDLLSTGEQMQEMIHIAKGQEHGNCVSIIRGVTTESSGLYLQESWSDASGAMIVYSAINGQSLNMVMSCGDSSFIPVRPSGFAILPDGNNGGGGSLLTIGLQMLQTGHQTAKLSIESVETVNNLMTCTIQKIKDALGVA